MDARIDPEQIRQAFDLLHEALELINPNATICRTLADMDTENLDIELQGNADALDAAWDYVDEAIVTLRRFFPIKDEAA